LVLKTKNYFVRVSEMAFSLMLLVTSTDITVWVVSALLALGIGLSKYAKWKARNQLVRELAAMDRERREKVLSRMNPAQAMEARQELMRRFNIFCMLFCPCRATASVARRRSACPTNLRLHLTLVILSEVKNLGLNFHVLCAL